MHTHAHRDMVFHSTPGTVGPSSSWPWAASLPWSSFLDPPVSSCLIHRDTHMQTSPWYPVQIMALLVANHRSHGLFSHCSGPRVSSSSQLTDLLPSSVFVPGSWLLQYAVPKPLILLNGYSGLMIASNFALTDAPQSLQLLALRSPHTQAHSMGSC